MYVLCMESGLSKIGHPDIFGKSVTVSNCCTGDKIFAMIMKEAYHIFDGKLWNRIVDLDELVSQSLHEAVPILFRGSKVGIVHCANISISNLSLMIRDVKASVCRRFRDCVAVQRAA